MEKSFVALNYGGNQIALGSVEATDVNISSNITSYPIYSGDTVGEHMIREPITMTIRGSYATNGSNSVLINAIAPSLKLFQQEIEKLRDNGTLVDIYKIAYNQNDPRFIKRTGMALKSIAWVEHFNSVEFSFSFQQVMVSDKVYTGNSSAYSTTPSGGDPNYNQKTGNIDVPETGEKIPTAREPGKTSNEDGIEITADNDVPSFSEAYSSDFLETYLKKEDVMAAIIAICVDEEIVDKAFLEYYNDCVPWQGIVASAASVAVGAVLGVIASHAVTNATAAAIALGLSATTPIGPALLGLFAAGLIAVGTYYLVYSVVYGFETNKKKRKFKKAVFEYSRDRKTREESVKRFDAFLEDIYNEMTKFDEYFLVYEFPSHNEHQTASITIGGSQVYIETERTSFGLGCKFKVGSEIFQTLDMYASAKKDYGDCGEECAFFFFDGETPYYGNLLWADREKAGSIESTDDAQRADPSDFVIAISSMTPADFSKELSNAVFRHVYANYQDVIGE